MRLRGVHKIKVVFEEEPLQYYDFKKFEPGEKSNSKMILNENRTIHRIDHFFIKICCQIIISFK